MLQFKVMARILEHVQAFLDTKLTSLAEGMFGTDDATASDLASETSQVRTSVCSTSRC